MYRDRDKALAYHDGKYCAPDKSGQAILACHRDSFTTQNQDKNPAGCASNANSLNCRAVSCKANLSQVLIILGLPTRKQEYCSPSLQPSLRCKTHAFLPTRTPLSRQINYIMTTPAPLPGLCHHVNFIITFQLLAVYKVLTVKPTSS